MSELCRLTIVIPAELEEDVVEMLLCIDPPLGGFSAVHADGHGQDFERANVSERVRGRTARLMLHIVLARTRVQMLLERLHETVAGTQSVWWTEPVEQFGRLG